MKRTPTKHCRIWLVVNLQTGTIDGVHLKRCDAAYQSRKQNDLLERDIFGVRPAFTSETKGKR